MPRTGLVIDEQRHERRKERNPARGKRSCHRFGSITQRRRLVELFAPNSSPRIASSGKLFAITPQIASSASRSASVTGEPSLLVSTATLAEARHDFLPRAITRTRGNLERLTQLRFAHRRLAHLRGHEPSCGTLIGRRRTHPLGRLLLGMRPIKAAIGARTVSVARGFGNLHPGSRRRRPW